MKTGVYVKEVDFTTECMGIRRLINNAFGTLMGHNTSWTQNAADCASVSAMSPIQGKTTTTQRKTTFPCLAKVRMESSIVSPFYVKLNKIYYLHVSYTLVTHCTEVADSAE